MPIKYINPDGSWDRLVGKIECDVSCQECNVVVDGKPYKWEELKENVMSYEGFQIIIEFADPSDIVE